MKRSWNLCSAAFVLLPIAALAQAPAGTAPEKKSPIAFAP